MNQGNDLCLSIKKKKNSTPEFFYGGGKVEGYVGAVGSFTKQNVISEQALLMHKTQATHTIA